MKQVSVGRSLVSRNSLFFNQWLVAASGEGTGPQSTFSRFEPRVERESESTTHDLLLDVKAQAEQYQDWTARADGPVDIKLLPIAVFRELP